MKTALVAMGAVGLSAAIAFAAAVWLPRENRSSRAPSASAAVAIAARTGQRPIVTTDGNLAMRNLEGELVDARQRVSRAPTDVAACLQLSGVTYLRARVTGEIDELASAVDKSAECARIAPNSPDAWVTKAGQEQTLHRFVRAEADLARARSLGADPARVASLQRELDWNAGKWADAAVSIRAAAASAPTTSNLTRAARLEHDLGHHDAADALYLRALSLVDDTGPIPVAMMEVQRGINLSDGGRVEEAIEVFQSAAKRLPKYTAAKEHFAEAASRVGRIDDAITVYEGIVASSTDPEFMGQLASLYRSKGKIALADALRAKATHRYQELLAKYPEAMAWHAAEYFAEEGNDPARARALLQANAKLRPNPESLEALAKHERLAGEVARAEDLTRKAESIRASAQRRANEPR